MRFKEKIINGKGNEVFTFIFGKSELELLLSMSIRLRRELPINYIETQSTKYRLNNFIKEFSKYKYDNPTN